MPLLFNVKQMPAKWRAAGSDCNLAWFDPYLKVAISLLPVYVFVWILFNIVTGFSVRIHPETPQSHRWNDFPEVVSHIVKQIWTTILFRKTVQYQIWRQKRRKHTAGLKSDRHYLELTHWIGCLSIGMSSLWYREMTTRRFCKRIQAQQNHRRQDQKKDNQHLKWTIIFHFTYYSRTSSIDLESTDLGWFR